MIKSYWTRNCNSRGPAFSWVHCQHV